MEAQIAVTDGCVRCGYLESIICGLWYPRQSPAGDLLFSPVSGVLDNSQNTTPESLILSALSRLLLLLLPRPYCHNIPANMYAPYKQLWLAISWSSYARKRPGSRKYCSFGYYQTVASPHVFRQHSCFPMPFCVPRKISSCRHPQLAVSPDRNRSPRTYSLVCFSQAHPHR